MQKAECGLFLIKQRIQARCLISESYPRVNTKVDAIWRKRLYKSVKLEHTLTDVTALTSAPVQPRDRRLMRNTSRQERTVSGLELPVYS